MYATVPNEDTITTQPYSLTEFLPEMQQEIICRIDDVPLHYIIYM